MSIWLAVLLVVVGAAVVQAFSGRLVRGVAGTSATLGLSAFLISVIFVGFDPENLAVGAAGAYEGVAGIAAGSIVGAAMVALAFGLTALIAPMRFERVPPPLLAVPVTSVLVFAALAVEGRLSRVGGVLLLIAYAIAVVFLIRLSRRGVDIESARKPREVKTHSRWKAVGLMVLSLVAILVGSEMLVEGSKTLIDRLGFTDTFYGMVILALLVSVEEVARELPAARAGHPEISFGNAVGSVLAFFLFNGGVIALVRPIDVVPAVLHFYLPMTLGTVLILSVFMWRKAVPRWAGAVLALLYVAFAAGGYWMGVGAHAAS